MQGYENLFIKCAYEHIAQKMDQVSEAYPSGRLCGRVNMTSYQEKKFQQFHHWCTSHVRLSLLLKLKIAHAQANPFQYYFCEGIVVFIFTSKTI